MRDRGQKRGDYLLPVKGNQPTLLQDIKGAFRAIEEAKKRADGEIPIWLARDWKETGVQFGEARDSSWKKRHGRQEERVLTVLSDPEHNDYLGSAGQVGKPWPHLKQIVRIDRTRTIGEMTTTEITYYITSRPSKQANAEQLQAWIRQYWSIENQLHYVRDETFGEDRSQIRSGGAPQVMAACRNLVLTLLRRRGHANVAAALRTFAARPLQAISLLLSAHLLQ